MLFSLSPAAGVSVTCSRTGALMVKKASGEVKRLGEATVDGWCSVRVVAPQQGRRGSVREECTGFGPCKPHGHACPEWSIRRRLALARRLRNQAKQNAALAAKLSVRRAAEERRQVLRRAFEARRDQIWRDFERVPFRLREEMLWTWLAADMVIADLELADCHFLSHKERNKLQHALNGNIFGIKLGSLPLKWLFGLSNKVSYDLDIEETVLRATFERIEAETVADPIVEIQPEFAHLDFLDHTVEIEAEILRLGGKYLCKCKDVIKNTSCNGLVFVTRDRTRYPLPSVDRRQLTVPELFAIVAPVLCDVHLGASEASATHMVGAISARHENNPRVPDRLNMQGRWDDCEHHDGFDSTLDELALLPPDVLGPRRDVRRSMHRPSAFYGGHRCSACFPSSYHHWSPELVAQITSVHKVPETVLWRYVQDCLKVRKAWLRDRKPALFTITAYSAGEITLLEDHRVFVLHVPAVTGVDSIFQRGEEVGRTVCVPIPVSRCFQGRPLATMRIFAAALMPMRVRPLVRNAVGFEPMQIPAYDFPNRIGFFTIGGGFGYYCLFAARYSSGNYRWWTHMSLGALVSMAHIYGTDEYFLSAIEAAHGLRSNFVRGPVALATIDRPATMHVFRTDMPHRRSLLTPVSRVAFAAAASSLAAVSLAGLPLVLSRKGTVSTLSGAAIVTLTRDFERGMFGRISPKRIVLVASFGSRGDRLCHKPAFASLADLGFHVVFVDLLPLDQEEEFMRHANAGRLHRTLPYFLAARACLIGLPFTIVTPSNLCFPGLQYSLSLPMSSLRPSLSVLSNVWYALAQLVGNDGPVLRIGHFGSWLCAPRSTDGETFDRRRPRAADAAGEVFVPGSTFVDTSMLALDVLSPGDHAEALTHYVKAHVVGIGAAQTAYMSGCEVVMHDTGIDRCVTLPGAVHEHFGPDGGTSNVAAALTAAYPSLLGPVWGAADIWLKVALLPRVPYLCVKRYWWQAVMLLAVVWSSIGAVSLAHDLPTTVILAVLGSKTASGYLAAIVIKVCIQVFSASWTTSVTDLASAIVSLVVWLHTVPEWYLLMQTESSVLTRVVFVIILRRLLFPVLETIISTLLRSDPETAKLECRFIWMWIFPAVHTNYVSPDGSMMSEGKYIAPLGLGSPYRWVTRPYEAPIRWSLMLPTGVPWRDVVRPLVVSGSYGPTFNCQVLVLAAAGRNAARLGVGLLVMLPFLFLMWAAMGIAFVLVAFLSMVIPILDMIRGPEAPTNIFFSYVGTAGFYLQAAVTLMVIPNIDLLTRLTYCLELYSSVWADRDPDAITRLSTVNQVLTTIEASTPKEGGGMLRRICRLQHGINMSEAVATALYANWSAALVSVPKPLDEVNDPLAFIEAMLQSGHVAADVYEWVKLRDSVSPLRLGDGPDEHEDLTLACTVGVREFISMMKISQEFSGLMGRDFENHLENWTDEVWSDAQEEATVPWHADEVTELGCRVIKWYYFNDPTVPTGDVDEAISEEAMVDASAHVASLVRAGADLDQATLAVAKVFAASASVEEMSRSGYEATLQLYSEVAQARLSLGVQFDTALAWYYDLRGEAHRKGWFWFFPVELLYLFMAKGVGDATKIINALTSVAAAASSEMGYDQALSRRIAVVVASFMDVIDVRHRTSLKPAWALLLDKMKYRLSKGDFMMASVVASELLPAASYAEWSDQMKELMENSDIDVSQLYRQAPSRQVFTPRATYGIAEYAADMSFFRPKIIETARERRMIETAIAHGAKRGVDQVWMSSPEALSVSLSRYTVNRPTPSVVAEAKIIEAADSMFDDYPEMYDQPRGMSINGAIAASEWKYSAGLPFLPVVKKRSDLRNTAWVSAIRAGAGRLLSSGKMPKVGFHCFPKAQVVAYDKATNPEKLRSVTAGDRLHHTAYLCLAAERDKRLPPLRALKLPSLPRTEGGMQDVYKELSVFPNFFKTDGTRFDSTVVSSVVVEGPTRLWQRGVEGTWGELATTSWMRAYYHAISEGLLVNLMSGEDIYKNGGGGTGSAATSKDNEKWAEICFRASWSIAMDLPCSDFRLHVRMAQASDDITLSVSDLTAKNVQRWRDVMQIEYGVDFQFEETDGADDMLHLVFVRPEDTDWDAYMELQLEPSAIKVRHDPAALFLRRSEYRSDRMGAGHLKQYDAIATRDIGHAYLTAHNRRAYSDIALSWEEACTSFLLSYFRSVSVVRGTDAAGLTVQTELDVDNSRPAVWVLNLANKYHPDDVDDWVDLQQTFALRWMRAHRLPSYRRVFGLWTARPQNSAILQRYQKLPFSRLPIPFMDTMRLGTIAIIDGLQMVPKALVGITGEPDALPLATRYVDSSLIMETFIFWKFHETHFRDPSLAEFVQLCRVAPFGSVLDPFVFFGTLQNAAADTVLRKPSSSNKAANALKVLLTLALYTFMDVLMRWAQQMRFIGTFLIVFFFVTREVDIIYSLLSIGWWIAYGAASVAISNLASRDPYLIYKWSSITLVAALTPVLGDEAHPFIWEFTKWFAWPAMAVTTAMAMKLHLTTQAERILRGSSDSPDELQTVPESPYRAIAGGLRAQKRASFNMGHPPPRGFLVDGGIGSGKSTVFVAEFLASASVATVFLLMPNNLLVNEYTNSFIPKHLIVKLHAGQVDLRLINARVRGVARKRLVVMTYGLFLAYLAPLPSSQWAEPSASCLDIDEDADVVLIDECGIPSAESFLIATHMNLVNWASSWGGMSGTPGGPVTDRLIGQRFNVPPRQTGHVVERQVLPLAYMQRPRILADGSQVMGKIDWTLALSEIQHHAVHNRIMTVCSSLAMAERIAEGIRVRWKDVAWVVSRSAPFAPLTGHLACTSIVDTGVTLDPPPHLLVEDGVQLAKVMRDVPHRDLFGDELPVQRDTGLRSAPYSLIALASSEATHNQRCGRLGRKGDGVIMSPPYAGKGPPEKLFLAFSAVLALPKNSREEVFAVLGFECPWVVVDNTRTIYDLVNFSDRDALWATPAYIGQEAFFLVLYALWESLGNLEEAIVLSRSRRAFEEHPVTKKILEVTGKALPVMFPETPVIRDQRWMHSFHVGRIRPRGILRARIPFWNPDQQTWQLL